jgi:malonate-semialdehyde dehydrogenase (acetylating)/methylmalonate-semialdehyde dehydrogenase
MQTIQNAIDGRRVTSASRRIALYNPATGEQTAELPLTVEEV